MTIHRTLNKTWAPSITWKPGMIQPWSCHQPHLCCDPTRFLSVLQMPLCAAWGTWRKRNVLSTACSGSLPHVDRFYTVTYSMCIELRNAYTLFLVVSVGSMLAEISFILLTVVAEPGTQQFFNENLVNDVCGHSSWPYPKAMPPLSSHGTPCPPCMPLAQAANLRLGPGKWKTRCLVSYRKYHSWRWKEVETSFLTSVVISLHCEAGDLNLLIYF